MKKLFALVLALLVFPCLAFSETVVTSFYPIWVMTLNLTKGLEDHVSVRNMAAPSAGCLHDYQLQTADMKALSGADLFLVNGAGMEAFLPEITRALPDLPVVEASEGIDLLKQGDAVEILEPEEEEEVNAHLWLDPSRAVRMAENLAAGLVRLLPSDEAAITANLEDYRSRLTVLDQQLRDGLKNLARRDIITFHEAFNYFAEAYGIEVAGVIAHEPGENPSTREIAETCDLVKKLGILEHNKDL